MLKLLSVLFAACVSVHAEVPSSPRAGRTEFRGSASYFSTSANYGAGGGGSEELPGGGSLTSIMGEFLFNYEWRPDWRLYGGATAGYVETDDGAFTRTNSGVNELMAGAQNWYEMGRFDIAVQGDFIFPIYKVDDGGDEALLGEGAMRARGGAWAIYPMGLLRPFGYAAFEYRDGGRAFLIPYSLGAKYRMGKFWIQGEYRGYETIVDDADTDNRDDRDIFLEQVNGGSYRFYSINPAVSEFAIEAGVRLGSIMVFGGFAMTVNGSSAADGYTAMAGLAFSPTDARGPVIQEEDFDIRSERFDESVFQNERAPKEPKRFEEPQFREDPNFVEPSPVAPENTPINPSGNETAPAPKPTKPRKTPKQQAIDDAQDVEMQIELQQIPAKKKKKKKKKKNVDKLLNDAEKFLENPQ
jgi:hypothetical protein